MGRGSCGVSAPIGVRAPVRIGVQHVIVGAPESALEIPADPEEIAEATATTAMRVEGPIESRRSALDARIVSADYRDAKGGESDGNR